MLKIAKGEGGPDDDINIQQHRDRIDNLFETLPNQDYFENLVLTCDDDSFFEVLAMTTKHETLSLQANIFKIKNERKEKN